MNETTTYYSDMFYAISLAWTENVPEALTALVDSLLSGPEPNLQSMFTEDEWNILTLVFEEVRCV